MPKKNKKLKRIEHTVDIKLPDELDHSYRLSFDDLREIALQMEEQGASHLTLDAGHNSISWDFVRMETDEEYEARNRLLVKRKRLERSLEQVKKQLGGKV